MEEHGGQGLQFTYSIPELTYPSGPSEGLLCPRGWGAGSGFPLSLTPSDDTAVPGFGKAGLGLESIRGERPPAQGMGGMGGQAQSRAGRRGGHTCLRQDHQELPPSGNLFCLPAPETCQGVKVTCDGAVSASETAACHPIVSQT